MKPISSTAFYYCGVRMQDAESEKPLCHDTYAKHFMDGRGLSILHHFFDEKKSNAANVVRHRLIDDIIQSELSANPDLFIILIGAGFDSRAYRLHGGRWLEIDEPQVIDYKNHRLPTSVCHNHLQRLAIDFENESMSDKLQNFATVQPVLVVFEGVFIYLAETTIKQTLPGLYQLFPQHKLVCDLMSSTFNHQYSRSVRMKFSDLGAKFRFTPKKPSAFFAELDYQLCEKYSIVGKAIELGAIKISTLIFKTLLKTLKQGFAVYVFESQLR